MAVDAHHIDHLDGRIARLSRKATDHQDLLHQLEINHASPHAERHQTQVLQHVGTRRATAVSKLEQDVRRMHRLQGADQNGDEGRVRPPDAT